MGHCGHPLLTHFGVNSDRLKQLKFDFINIRWYNIYECTAKCGAINNIF